MTNDSSPPNSLSIAPDKLRRRAARYPNGVCRLCGHDHNMPPCPASGADRTAKVINDLLSERAHLRNEMDRLRVALEMHDQIERDTHAQNQRLAIALRGMLHLYERYDPSTNVEELVTAARKELLMVPEVPRPEN